MDIIGKTVTEYALERRIAELERENAQLRHEAAMMGKRPPSAISDVKEVSVSSLPPQICVPWAVRVTSKKEGFSYRIQASTRDGLNIGYYMAEEMWAYIPRFARADMLLNVFQSVARALADEIGRVKDVVSP